MSQKADMLILDVRARMQVKLVLFWPLALVDAKKEN
jgi:hypothetical protein